MFDNDLRGWRSLSFGARAYVKTVIVLGFLSFVYMVLFGACRPYVA